MYLILEHMQLSEQFSNLTPLMEKCFCQHHTNKHHFLHQNQKHSPAQICHTTKLRKNSTVTDEGECKALKHKLHQLAVCTN